MDIKEIVEEKEKLRRALLESSAEHINVFKEKTGLQVKVVDLEFNKITLYNGQNHYTLSGIDVQIDLNI